MLLNNFACIARKHNVESFHMSIIILPCVLVVVEYKCPILRNLYDEKCAIFILLRYFAHITITITAIHYKCSSYIITNTTEHVCLVLRNVILTNSLSHILRWNSPQNNARNSFISNKHSLCIFALVSVSLIIHIPAFVR